MWKNPAEEPYHVHGEAVDAEQDDPYVAYNTDEVDAAVHLVTHTMVPVIRAFKEYVEEPDNRELLLQGMVTRSSLYRDFCTDRVIPDFMAGDDEEYNQGEQALVDILPTTKLGHAVNWTREFLLGDHRLLYDNVIQKFYLLCGVSHPLTDQERVGEPDLVA